MEAAFILLFIIYIIVIICFFIFIIVYYSYFEESRGLGARVHCRGQRVTASLTKGLPSIPRVLGE